MKLFHDDFRDGFGARWRVLPGGDAITACCADGLTVRSADVDAASGEPRFSRAPRPGDHIAWAALAGPGAFAASPGEGLSYTATLSATVYGIDAHPFGAAVADAQSDLRLSAAFLVATDLAGAVAFDFALTNTALYAVYERRPNGSRQAAFTYAVPVGRRDPGQWHECRIDLGGDGTTVSWHVDGREVLGVDEIGRRALGDEHLISAQAGEDDAMTVRRLSCGIGLLTMLEPDWPSGGWRPGAELRMRRAEVSATGGRTPVAED